MKRRFAILVSVSLFVLSCLPIADHTVSAQQPTGAGRRNLEIAELRLRLFERVDYPLALRKLESQIRVARAEVDSLERQLTEIRRLGEPYRPTKPYVLDEERIQISLVTVRENIANLEEERLLLIRYQHDERRLRELEVAKARERLYSDK